MTKTKSRHLLDMLAEVPDSRKARVHATHYPLF